jgi:hypothetical protein
MLININMKYYTIYFNLYSIICCTIMSCTKYEILILPKYINDFS